MSSPRTGEWDLAVVGAGPAGACAALAARRSDPTLRVLLLDRSAFPRDKSCGDGVAPHVIDLLAELGCADRVTRGWHPVHRLRLRRRDTSVDRPLARPTWVIPRVELDHRLVQEAEAAGVTVAVHRVRSLGEQDGRVHLGDGLTARVVVGADGAQSVVRRAVGPAEQRMALALRGYTPTPPHLRGAQTIVFGHDRQPAYAWCFDRGDGLANVGYGELLPGHGAAPARPELIGMLEELIPGTTAEARDWRGARLPLSAGSWHSGRGPVLLAGDAAGLVNPMTGEGIYYAVLTGIAAGRAAAAAIADANPVTAAQRYRSAVEPHLARHLRHIDVAGRLCRHEAVIDAGLRASAASQRVFDEIVELGLARGVITPYAALALAGRLPSGLRQQLTRRLRHHRKQPT